ncbi:MAG TPA: glycosyltransferase family 2 protein [Verrucomicrobiae bacterium]|nr:glycosyltransferase family 2 protein [Verrucomicrobiae bacterium]
MTDAPKISVVVCTYNRAALLRDALETLCEQTLATASYEVLVVDNNSADNTRAVVEGFAARPLNVRYARETRQGLSMARNRGWQEARGEYVAYIDDDCRAPKEWLASAEHVICRLQPAVLCGPVFPFYQGQKARWYEDRYATHLPCTEARRVDAETCGYVYGGNCFFRRSVLQAMGGFDPRLGMSGGKLGYSEETVLVRRIAQTMPDEVMYYDPQLPVSHLVRPEKMTLRWLLRASFPLGRASCYWQPQTKPLSAYAGLGYYRQALSTIMALGKMCIRGVLFRERDRYPYFQNYIYERSLALVSELGRHYELHQQIKRAQRPGLRES